MIYIILAFFALLILSAFSLCIVAKRSDEEMDLIMQARIKEFEKKKDNKME